MRPLLALPLLAVLGCSKPLEFVFYEPETKEFSVEVPKWDRDDRAPFTGGPIAEVRWIGDIVDRHEGEAYGAVLTIRRISRTRKDFPGAKEYAAFKKNVLDTGESILAGKAGVPVTRTEDGFRYGRHYEQRLGGGLHGPERALPMRVETIVRRTPRYDYVIELRATRKLFDRRLPALIRANETFKPARP